jgi:hypothetical protein
MSWRIEHANPFALVQELPDGWAQTCFVRAPRDLPAPCLLAILDDLHRVVRDDGTLWLALPGRRPSKQLVALIEVLGWRVADGERWRGPLTLLTKQAAFYLNPRPRPFRSLAGDRQTRCPGRPRRAWCVPASAAIEDDLVQWCILAGSAPYACGVCGAAWKRRQAAKGSPVRWVPACRHTNDRGRCLVLEPFCGMASIGIAAVRLGRGYLGIEPDAELAARADRRLARQLEPSQ